MSLGEPMKCTSLDAWFTSPNPQVNGLSLLIIQTYLYAKSFIRYAERTSVINHDPNHRAIKTYKGSRKNICQISRVYANN